MAGRKKGFFAAMAANAARAQREAERSRKWEVAERERASRAAARFAAAESRSAAQAAKAADKGARLRHQEQRQQQVDELNERTATTLSQLRGILEATLSVNDTLSFDSLRVREQPPALQLPSAPAQFPPPSPPGLLGRLLPGSQDRYQKAVKAYEAEQAELRVQHESQVEKAKIAHASAVRALELKAQQRDAEVTEWEAGYRSGDPEAVVAYNTMVLERSEYPDGFPQHFRVAYVPESKQLVIDYELAPPSIVPTISEYTYVKNRDAIQEKPRKPAEVKELYQEIVAAVTLRTLHEVLEADQGDHIAVAAFSGFVQAVDPATGKDIRPYLISVRAPKQGFLELDLSRIDKRACLRNLGAQLSARPSELQAVKPILEFDMVDKRFIDQVDILSGLDERPNLLELTPSEFEALVSNLFQRMGLDTRLTRSSRDGGVDAVAFDTRPIVGGKVVIQAKRYRDTVGVSAVRDLYGTMMNEGANKGILVSTSGYGPDAFTFAKDKPIELIDGGGLLYLLEENGIRARIVFPQDG